MRAFIKPETPNVIERQHEGMGKLSVNILIEQIG